MTISVCIVPATRLHIPNVREPVGASGGQFGAVGREGDGVNGVRVPQEGGVGDLLELVPHLPLVQPHTLVSGGRGGGIDMKK